MRVVGLDLAGSPKNETGFCLLADSGGKKAVATRLLHSNEEILSELKASRPDLVAVDAPLIYHGERRGCDELLREYGALPVTLRGMETLAQRGKALAAELDDYGFAYIEVYAKASAKILGVYHKDDFPMQKAVMGLDLQGELNSRILTRDELDAVVAAVTGYLHLMGQTRTVGDSSGMVVLPKV
jgi:predicted nuclease with RNAse H fold